MEQIKKLPIVEQVPFTAYQTRGFEAGILLGNFKNAEELLFQTCINFFFRINGNIPLFDYTCDKTNWFMDQGIFYRQIYPIDRKYHSREDILSLILHWLNQDVYVYGFFNEKYIPHKNAFGRYDFKHAYLIYGYDQTEQNFFAMGYTDHQKFEKYLVSYEDFFNGIEHVDEQHFFPKYLDRACSCTFDLYQTYWELQDYLRSEYTAHRSHGKHPDDIYGISANRAFQRYVYAIDRHGNYLDPRLSRLFFENKAFMVKRLGYMAQKGYISNYHEEYSLLAEKSQKIHLLFLKYNLKRDGDILQSIDQIFTEVNDREEKILNRVFDELTDHFKRKREGMYL